MLSTVKRQQVPLKIELIVFGYIRESELFFDSTTNPYFNIPDLITLICLSFYYNSIGFDKHKCGSSLNINGLNDNTVTCTNGGGPNFASTAYHTEWFHSQQKIKIIYKLQVHFVMEYTMFIGFASIDTIFHKFYSNEININYALQLDGDPWIKYNKQQNCKLQFKNGDIISLTLNLLTSQIFVSRNEGKEVLLFNSIKTGQELQYKLAVSFYEGKKNDSITIMNIEYHYK